MNVTFYILRLNALRISKLQVLYSCFFGIDSHSKRSVMWPKNQRRTIVKQITMTRENTGGKKREKTVSIRTRRVIERTFSANRRCTNRRRGQRDFYHFSSPIITLVRRNVSWLLLVLLLSIRGGRGTYVCTNGTQWAIIIDGDTGDGRSVGRSATDRDLFIPVRRRIKRVMYNIRRVRAVYRRTCTADRPF